ncbi:transporter substrate-binding domain-containing protein [Vibrio sp. PP-XX7]
MKLFKMNLLKMLAAVAASAMLMSYAGIAAADQVQTIQQRGVLKVAVPQDFPPFGSVALIYNLKDMILIWRKYFAKQMHVKLQLVPVTSANRIPYLQTQKVDLVISSMGKNPQREKAIEF